MRKLVVANINARPIVCVERPITERPLQSRVCGFIIGRGLTNLMELVDRLMVLHEGRILVDGRPEEVVEHEEVINAYMGEPLNETTY